MPEVSEMVHPRGLNFKNQRKVMLYREGLMPGQKGIKMGFKKIALRVRNLQKKPSTEDVVRRVYAQFNTKKDRVQYKFARCGRKPWKLTKEVSSFVIRHLLKKRRCSIVTSTTLQAAVSRELGVKITEDFGPKDKALNAVVSSTFTNNK